MLDVKRLQVLLSVVELGSVTAAADALVYTPSAVSQQLRRLEREVGQPLLRRHARGMSPTDAGTVLAAHARTVIRQLAAAEADLAEIAGLRQGTLALGTFPTVASSFLPPVVHRFSERHPAVRLDIRSERLPQLIEWLENGTVDLSLLWDYAWRRLDSAQLDLTEMFSDPTVLLVSSRAPAGPQATGGHRRSGRGELGGPAGPPRGRGAAAGRGGGRVRAEGVVPGQRLPGGASDGGHRFRRGAGPAHRGAEPAAQRPRHRARRAWPPAGYSSATAGTGSTRPPRRRSTSSWSRSGRGTAPNDPPTD